MTILAFLLVLLSACIHATWNFIVKKISGHFSVCWIGLCISAAASIIFSFLLPFEKKFNADGIIYFILTGIIHVVYFIFLIQAYKSNDLSSAYPLARGLGVLGAGIFGILIFNEDITLLKITGIFLILYGILTVSVGKGMSFLKNIKHNAYALMVGLMIICYSLTDKKGVQHISPILFSISIFTLPALFLAPYVLKYHRSSVVKCLKEYKLASMIIGLGSFLSYVIILFVFQHSDVSYVVPVRETSVAIGAILGFLILKEKITFWKALAIVAITAGLIMIKIS